MKKTMIIMFLLVALGACKEDKKEYFMEVEGVSAGIEEGEIQKINLYLNKYENEVFEDNITILSTDPTIASTRRTRDDVKKSVRGYYLLAHRPGTVTLGAMKKGNEIATVDVTILEQQ